MFASYRNRVTTTTSLRQGRFREEGSEGSQRQICEPTDRNVIEGRVSGASQHRMTKPIGPGDTVNDTVVQRQFTPLSGEVCSMTLCRSMGAGLRCIWKRMCLPPDPTERIGFYGSRTEAHFERNGITTEPYGDSKRTLSGNVGRQVEQKSAEAIVAKRFFVMKETW